MSKWLGYQVGRVRLSHHVSNSTASFRRKRQKACFEHLPYQKDSGEFMFFSILMAWPWKFTVPFPLEEHPWFPWLPSRVARLIKFVEDRRVSPYLWGQHGWEGRAYIYRSNVEEVQTTKRSFCEGRRPFETIDHNCRITTIGQVYLNNVARRG